MFFLFFDHLGIGLLVCLLLVPSAKLGRRFLAFNLGLALVFLVLAAAARSHAAAGIGTPLATCIGLAAAALATLGLRTRAVPLGLTAAAAVAGAWGIVHEARHLASAPQAHASAALLGAHFATSALLAGAVTLDMILGHFYLVIPNLSFGPLRRLTLAFAVALVLRLVVTGWTLVASWDAWRTAWTGDATRFFLQYGFFLTLRVGFGIVGPLVLVWLVWQCVRIRANQSATGILYVATAIVLIGEIAAKYFLTTEALLL